ncbi:hypothetical protein ABH310_19140, partial [Chromobacterium piscinae]
MLVDFIEGDIDRPVITGVLYNGSHPTPDFSGADHRRLVQRQPPDARLQRRRQPAR